MRDGRFELVREWRGSRLRGMSDEKTPQEHISDALDRFAEAGWIQSHARSTQVGVAVQWTDEGTKKAKVLWSLLGELNYQGMSPDTLRAMMILISMKFDE